MENIPSGFADPLSRGCTRVATLVGVPLIPMILVSGAFLVGGVWAFYLVSPYASVFFGCLYLPLYVWMRRITKKDEHRLKQMMIRARLRLRQNLGRRFFGVVSYSPIRYKRR